MSSEENDDQIFQEIVDKIHELYVNGPDSISQMSKDARLSILAPRRKLNVMIIGNHSAGKSSFINWYIGDKIQRTGVAIETQGFTFITSGRKKTLAPIKGESTIMMHPYLKAMKEKFGKNLVENLSTHVSTSTNRHFPMIEFIDTPGLVDGEVSYPFDVNDAIFCMAKNVDLIFVFLDPMGQALCSRTMKVVKSLNAEFYDKMKYYLSKADTVTQTKELMKLMVQITQNIKDNISNQHGLEIPAIWLPEVADEKNVDVELNQIESLCDVMSQTINQKVQDNLNQVEEDCKQIQLSVKKLLAKNEVQKAAKSSRKAVGACFLLTAWTIPFLVTVALIGKYQAYLPSSVQEADYVMNFVNSSNDMIEPVLGISNLGFLGTVRVVGSCIGLFLLLFVIAQVIDTRTAKFSTERKEVVKRWISIQHKLDDVMSTRQELFNTYMTTYTKLDEL